MTALPSQPATPHNLLHAWLAALATVVRDKGVLLLLIGAPLLYGFFYPWFYADEVLTRVPVAVVDMDRTSLSRQITSFADADPRIEVRLVTASEHEAQQALWRGIPVKTLGRAVYEKPGLVSEQTLDEFLADPDAPRRAGSSRCAR